MTEATLTTAAFSVGQLVRWTYFVCRGRRSWWPKDCRVVKVGPKLVRIAVPLTSGGERLIWTRPEKLEAR